MVTKKVDDIRTEISNELLTRLPNLDLTEGTPERDMFVEAPIAGELTTIWDQVIYTAKLHAPLAYYTDLNTEDLEAYLANYNIVPFAATYSTGSVTFYVKNSPSRDIIITSGSLVQTDSSSPITFSVTADYTMYSSLASYYYSATTNRYEIQCNVKAVSAGPEYRAGSGTVLVMSTAIAGIDGITNDNAISGGQAAETVESALRRVIEKFQGRNLSTTQGLKSYVQRYASTINVVGANDPEMIRDQGNGGCIDFYIIGETQTNGTDNITITSTGLTTPLTVSYTDDTLYTINQPVIQILSVIKNNVILTPNSYLFVADTGILKNSAHGYDHITLTSTGLTPFTEITLENASNLSYSSATFGSYLGHGYQLKKSALVNLTAGTDYQLDKRMDASTIQDITDGFGTVAGGIIDTGISGSLSTGKYIRIVENTKNIVNATGLALKVYAKDLTSFVIPTKDRMYIDPILGKFILPQPNYWSRCETFSNLITGDIGTMAITSTGTTGVNVLSSVTGKFTNAIEFATTSASGYKNGIITLTPSGLTGNGSFTTSFWLAPTYSDNLYDPSGIIYESSVKLYFNSNSYAEIYNVNTSTGYSATLDIYNGGSLASSTIILSMITTIPSVNFHHCYFTITNSDVSLYIDGSYSYIQTGTFAINSSNIKLIIKTSANTGITSASQLFIDNIKIWNEIPTASPLWEYNNISDNGLHYIYGATNGYIPKLLTPAGVSYNYVDPTADLNYFKSGDVIQINYIYNSIYSTIETDLNSTTNHYMNRDYLVRGMYPVTIDVTCRFKEVAGQDFDTVANSVQLSIATFIDGILNNGNVERADISNQIKSNASVDNIDLSLTTFYLKNIGGGTLLSSGDVSISRNEYPIAGTITLTRWT